MSVPPPPKGANVLNPSSGTFVFTHCDGFLVGLHAKHQHTFVMYVTDHRKYWASSFRHKHLVQGHRSTSGLQGLFDAFAAAIDEGGNISNITPDEETGNIACQACFTHLSVEHKITFSLSQCSGEEQRQLMATMITDLYRSLTHWRSQAKAQKRMVKKRAEPGILPPASPPRRGGEDEKEEGGVSAEDVAWLKKPLKSKVWKPSSRMKGCFSQPESYFPSVGNSHENFLALKGDSGRFPTRASPRENKLARLSTLANSTFDQEPGMDPLRQRERDAATAPAAISSANARPPDGGGGDGFDPEPGEAEGGAQAAGRTGEVFASIDE